MEREEYYRSLSFTISVGEKAQGGRAFQSIQITDDHDLLFLYIVEITEQDFLILKHDQSLNVDYQEFPGMLSQLFEYCLSSSKDERYHFRAVLDLTKPPESHFTIIEASSFRNLPHLHLKLKAANDEQLKKHLAAGLSSARKENEKLRESQSNLNEGLHLARDEVERVVHDNLAPRSTQELRDRTKWARKRPPSIIRETTQLTQI